MKRRRIPTEKIVEAIQQELPNYQLVEEVRPFGEYINDTRLVLEWQDAPYRFPKKIEFVDNTVEEEKLSFNINPIGKGEIFGNTKRKIYEHIKEEISAYIGYLDISQAKEMAIQYLNDVFSKSFIEKHRDALKERAFAIAETFFQQDANENDMVKSSILYGRLQNEVDWIPVCQADNHFAYTFRRFNNANELREYREDKIDLGSIYKVALPLRDSSEFGGGIIRPALVVGRSSNDFYYVVPLTHLKEDEREENQEYFVNNDEKGKPVYAVRGFVEPIHVDNVHEFVGKVHKNVYENIIKMLSRDNKIKTNIFDFSIGMGAYGVDDLIKAKSNAFDKTFALPDELTLYSMIERELIKEEKKAHKKLYNRKNGMLKYAMSRSLTDEVKFELERVDGKKITMQFSLAQPVEVYSNRKSIDEGALIPKMSPDKQMSATYRKYFVYHYPLFKFMAMKRFASFYHAMYVKKDCEFDLNTLVAFFEAQIDNSGLKYSGSYEEVIKHGIDAIEVDKVTETMETKQSKFHKRRQQMLEKSREEQESDGDANSI